jgi:glucokinase
LTNNGWRFSISELKKALSIERCLVINDFTALALSLPGLGKADVRALSGHSAASASQASLAVEGAPIAVLGPGTGLGVSGLFPIITGTNGSAKTSWRAIAGEGGHITLAAATDREAAVLERLRSRQAHISAEDVLSGAGLVRLYRAICEVEGFEQHRIEAHEISAAAIAKSDSACVLTVQQFSAFLGSVAGNLALTLGAKGGVYVGGGIVPKLGGAFDELMFRRRFEEKGRFIEYLRPIPTWVITAENPALVGASNALTWIE